MLVEMSYNKVRERTNVSEFLSKISRMKLVAYVHVSPAENCR